VLRSIRAGRWRWGRADDHFDARNLIAFAYRTNGRNLFRSQIIGAPDWMATERYDITPKVSPDLVARAAADPYQTPKLVQSLLEDRFRLKLHREVRELPVYALVLVRNERALGPQIHASDIDCDRERARCRIQSIPGRFTANGVTMPTLTAMLSTTAESLVIDRTGMVGSFAIDLDWSPNQAASDKPSIFTAVQEQLGLRLDSVRALTSS
jgi:uncharacterized protein (TIGR03435 family)